MELDAGGVKYENITQKLNLPRRGECRYAHGNLQAKYKKLL